MKKVAYPILSPVKLLPNIIEPFDKGNITLGMVEVFMLRFLLKVVSRVPSVFKRTIPLAIEPE